MNSSALPAKAVWFVICILALTLGCWLRAVNAPEWMEVDSTQSTASFRPWMVEADCYSQLARVQRILHGQGLIQNHFTVENWPEGLVPSTTAPFDYVILLLYAPLTLVTKYPLDWAGALVSPALWVALACFWMFFRSREFNGIGRALLVIGSAALPAIVWGTACGRPRHQSLILALMAIGLTAEYERWHVGMATKRFWNIFAGAIWGLACWTSLFEPPVVLISLVLFNLIVRRRESPGFLISSGSVMLAMLLLEGVHIFSFWSLSPEYYADLQRWLGSITEVQPMVFAGFIHRMTLVLVLLPFVAWGLWRRAGDSRTDQFLILLTCLLLTLSFYQSRWMYYGNLGELFLLVRYCQVSPMHWSRLIVLTIFFAGLGNASYVQVAETAQAEANLPSPQLAEISSTIDGTGGIMAPWWLSPGLLYFSGQPIVSGSSHCGISGIVASAKFYNATSWAEADRILQERRVRWVVIYDDAGFYYPVLNSARGILGLPLYTGETSVAESSVAQILVAGRYVPRYLQLRAVTQQLKLYEFVPDELH